uniref:DRBM domain-containing protein n=1 Tax=Graphocephala atropunctata TaxID=36148 RepID=A0A1B6LM85_9HEMI
MSATTEDPLSDSYESNEEFELNDVDKSLIMDLMIIQNFVRPREPSGSKEYCCSFSCEVCQGANKSSPTCKVDEGDLTLTEEKRKKIIKNLMHKFFEKAWLKKVLDKNRKKRKTNDNFNAFHNFNSKVKKVKKVSEELEGKPKQWVVKTIEIQKPELKQKKNVSIGKTQLKRNKEEKENMNLEKERSGFPGQIAPMDDTKGPFFINREWVNIEIYQTGLQDSKWNPTQVVYEICSQCEWGIPEFSEISYIVRHGFLFSVTIKGHVFVSNSRGKTKKMAKYYASSKFLHFIGFKFNHKSDQFTLPGLLVNMNQ